MNGKQLKNSILQWAIQGKLVPQDPNDEPASVLLERIREEKARLVKEKKIKKDKNESIIFRGDDNSHYEKFADGTVKCIDDEIPFEIPQSWCWCRFSAIYRLLTDGTHNTPKYTESGIPFISVKDMSSGKLSFSNTKFISEEEHKILSARCCPEYGDLLISKVGTTGIPLIIDTDKEFSIFVSLALIKFFPNHIDSKFLIHLINSPLVQEQVKRDTRGVGNKNWVLTAISNTLLAIPPLVEQKRIVSKIEEIMPIADKYEKSQEALDRLNTEIYDKLKKSVLQEAIQGKLVPQDPNDEPASKLLERIKAEKTKLFKEGKLKKKDLVDSVIFKGEDNKYYETIDGKTEYIDERIPFELPHNWCWATLGNLVQNCSGLAYKKENLDERSTSYIRVLRGGNIDDGQWTMKDDDVMIASKFVKPELLLTAGTFITPAVTSIEQMGKTALVRDDQPQTVVGGFVLMLLPFLRDWSLLNYLELIFQSEYYKGYCRSITNKSGQAFYNLSRQKLMQFLVPLPPLNERIVIANEVAKVNSMMR